MSKRIPPKNPQFFTFVCPDPSSLNGSVIPKSFTRKYLKGQSLHSALLRRGDYNWGVEIGTVELKNGISLFFKNGWERFMEENGVKTGDFIVFRLEEHLVFEVTVFDPTMCERPYWPSSKSDHHHVQELKKTNKGKAALVGVEAESTMLKHDIKHDIKHDNHVHEGSKKIKKGEAEVLIGAEAEALTRKNDHHPSFTSKITPYTVKGGILYIPTKFARSFGLSNRLCSMILRDEKQRSWPVCLRYNISHVLIGEGWRKFVDGNDLKEGDKFMLELIENGDQPVMNFRLLGHKKKQIKKPQNAAKCAMREAVNNTSSDGNYPHFVGTLKPYSIKRSLLYIPNKFVKSSNLSNGEIILTNEGKKSWTVEMKQMGDFYLARGWSDFCIANKLKGGYDFKLELIQNGKKPILKFTRLLQEKKQVDGRVRGDTHI